ncbi:MAG TPA: hypothetical protein VG028_03490 [Terriglobia bacterium]|nr:hypothetical protein [Terriglobia bacterium]
MKSEPQKRKPKSHYTMTAAALSSRRANLEKARAAPREKIYRATQKRQAASRANLAKAIAARKAPRGNASARLNALHDGLFVRDVARSVRRMGEDPAEFREHHNLFFRVFAPLDDQERAWVQRIADLSWKRLRYFRALARWELEALKKGFSTIPRPAPIDARETEMRAYFLARLFARFANRIDPLTRFQSRIDREIRKLLRRRSGGATKYRGYYPTGNVDESLDVMLDKILDDALKP